VKYEVQAAPQHHELAVPYASLGHDDNPALGLYSQPKQVLEPHNVEISAAVTELEAVPKKEVDLSPSGQRSDTPAQAIIHVESELLAEEAADDTKDCDVAGTPKAAEEPVTPAPESDQASAEISAELSESGLDTAAPATNLANKMDAVKDTTTPKSTTKGTAQRRTPARGPASHPIKSPPSNGSSSTKTSSAPKPGSASKNISLRPSSARKTLQKIPSSTASVSPGPNAARPTAASVAKREAGPHVSSSPVWKY